MLFPKLNAISVARTFSAIIIGVSISIGALASEDTPAAGTKSAAAGRIYYQETMRFITMEPDGKNPKTLPPFAGDDDYYYQPQSARLSPDGKRLAFGKAELVLNGNEAGVYPPNKIYIRAMENSQPAEKVVEMTGVELHSWVWSPDGTRLAFVSWDAKNQTRNWVVDLTTKKIDPVTFPKVKTEKFGEIEPWICAWSPDGAKFLVAAQGLYLTKTDGSDLRRVSEGPFNLKGDSCRFSPDGKQILFVTYNADRSNTIHVLAIAGGKARAVVEAANFGRIQACWSPDGRRIAYVVTFLDANGNRGEETNLNVVNADGSNSVTLLTEKHEPQVIKLTLTDWK